MINFYLCIENPWAKDKFENIYATHGSFTSTKAWEFEVGKTPQTVVSIGCSLSFRGQDHAGLRLTGCLFGRDATFTIYDTRHWDYENDSWVTKEYLES